MHCFALFGTFKPLEKALGALITHLHVVDFHESSAKLSTATCLYPLNCIRLHRFGKLNYLVGRPFFKGKLLLLKASRTASEIIKIANSRLYEHIIFSMLCKSMPLKALSFYLVKRSLLIELLGDFFLISRYQLFTSVVLLADNWFKSLWTNFGLNYIYHL